MDTRILLAADTPVKITKLAGDGGLNVDYTVWGITTHDVRLGECIDLTRHRRNDVVTLGVFNTSPIVAAEFDANGALTVRTHSGSTYRIETFSNTEVYGNEVQHDGSAISGTPRQSTQSRD